MAADQWFFTQNAQQQGPVSAAALRDLLTLGAVLPTDVVWTEGMAAWVPISWRMEFAPAPAAVPDPLAPTPQMPLSYFAAPDDFSDRYAGFWLRAVAWLIDTVLLRAALYGGSLLLGWAALMPPIAQRRGPVSLIVDSGLLMLLTQWLYFALFESSPKQATPGKMALDLIVTTEQGQRIGFGRATGRYFGKIISGIIFCIGYMMAGWTTRKQALHDQLAHTLVLRRTARV